MPHPSRLWQRTHKKQAQSTGGTASSSSFGGSKLAPGEPFDSHSTTSTQSSRSTSIFRSRSQKFSDGGALCTSFRDDTNSHGSVLTDLEDQNKFRRSLHRPDTPSSSGIAEYPATPSDPTSQATRIAETPAGQLITKAIASGQALHQIRPSSPPLSVSASSTRDDASTTNESTINPPMSTPGPVYPSSKTSSDSGQSVALDRWSQRRLQRLNTEQGFREQRQGGPQGVQIPQSLTSEQAVAYNANTVPVPVHSQNISDAAQQNLVQQTQPQPNSQAQQSQYQVQTSRTPPNANGVGLNAVSPPPPPPPHNSTDITRSPAHQQPFQHDAAGQPVHVPTSQQQNYSPDSSAQYQQPHARPNTLQQSRSFSQPTAGPDDSGSIMSTPSNAPLPAPKPVRSNRQSMHNGVASISPGAHHTSSQQPPQLQAPAPPPHTNDRAPTGSIGRATPQPQQSGEEMTPDEVNQLLKDHKELREKYTKVKKYYFEKEEQVKQLQNILAHQRLAQSRTSLDDSEYSTRLNRLDGLIAQLAFSIRKSWKAVPLWLASSVNKDAIQTGKQEMTAAGRAFISCWLVDEVFEKYFHPDLEPNFSAQLKTAQKNIRRFAPQSQTIEEEEHLCSKIANWRLATLDGLQDVLRSSHTTGYRSQLMEMLKEQLIGSLQVHLSDPPMSDLEGGVNMIIELAVSMATHIPLESRDVTIEYFMPGTHISNEVMKVENGIPALGTSVAEDAADRMSMKSSADSEDASQSYHDSVAGSEQQRTQKRSMLSALTGGKKGHAAQGKNAGAGSSSGSLGRPESAGKDERENKVRMAVGLAANIRGKTILIKAPVFSYT